jgi:hypothetical protein
MAQPMPASPEPLEQPPFAPPPPVLAAAPAAPIATFAQWW